MGALSSLATVGLNLALAQQSAKRSARDINSERDRQISALRQRDEEEQRRQQEALRRRLATQRARAGAAGVGSSGSSEAVLRGLTEEAEAAQSASDQASAQRIQDLRRRASRSRRYSLLDLVGGATSSGLGLLGSTRSRRSLLDL